MGEKVLQGIRVLEWGMLQQGPMATAYLADMGAEVIKLEALTGDTARYYAHFGPLGIATPDKSNGYFQTLNRGKKSISVDLKSPEGKALILKLVEKVDVFVTNVRFGVPEKLGLGYENLKTINPKLIYAHATGCGTKGPDRSAPMIDYIAMARTGIMTSIGDGKEPGFLQGAFSDQIGAICLCWGIVTALLARERLGIGQKVDINLLSAFANLNQINTSLYSWAKAPLPPNDRTHPTNPISNYYECKDGRWIMLGSYEPSSVKKFFGALGMDEIANKEEYATMEGVAKDSEFLFDTTVKVMKTKTCAEWQEFCRAHDIMNYPVATYEEFHKDPQMLENEGFYRLSYPGMPDPIQLVGAPFLMSETPAAVEKWAPKLGADTDDVLESLCGATPEEVKALREKKVIR